MIRRHQRLRVHVAAQVTSLMIPPAHPPASSCLLWSQEIKSITDFTRDFSAACYSVLYAGGRHYLVGVRLQDLEVRLPCPPFLRIHRSFLVNLDHVERMTPSGD